MFRKTEEKVPPKDARVRDFGMDPEHRKYVLSDEYEVGINRSMRDPYCRDLRDLGVRRRSSTGNPVKRCGAPENKKLGN